MDARAPIAMTQGDPAGIGTGLAPLAGEAGTMGREDLDVVAPAIAMLRAQGTPVTGPHPATRP